MSVTAELIENYRYYRARRYAAFNALAKARDELVIGKRRYGACKPDVTYGRRNAAGEGFVENTEGNLRTVFADEVEGIRLNHTGWWCDEFQDRKLRGVVVRLSHGRCFPAYRESDNGGLMVDWSDCHLEDRSRIGGARGCLIEAARAADSFAEHAAEKEREYNEAWQTGSRWADLGETITDLRTTVMALTAHLRAIRHDPMPKTTPKVAVIMRESICGCLSRIRKCKKERAELRSNYVRQNAFGYPERTLIDAFNEGAGLGGV